MLKYLFKYLLFIFKKIKKSVRFYEYNTHARNYVVYSFNTFSSLLYIHVHSMGCYQIAIIVVLQKCNIFNEQYIKNTYKHYSKCL